MGSKRVDQATVIRQIVGRVPTITIDYSIFQNFETGS